MKYVCLGYHDETAWRRRSPAEQAALAEECFVFDDQLKRNGHFVRGEALQGSDRAVTLRWRDGQASATDGPYAETKEVLGGILVLEAEDLDHAIRLMSRHPGLRNGPFEIRPLDEDITARANRRPPARARE